MDKDERVGCGSGTYGFVEQLTRALTLIDLTTGSKPRNAGPGYWITENVLSADECNDLVAALSIYSTKVGRAGARHLMSHPEVAALAMDQRLRGIASDALGVEAVPYRATLFAKSVQAKWFVVWHQDKTLPLESIFDAPGWGPWSRKAGIAYANAPTEALSRIIALRVHLDASTSDNGPLRIVSGSHSMGVMSEEEVLAFATGRHYVDCLVSQGGVLAMRPLLMHSSPRALNKEPRRVIHIEYAESLQLAPGIRLAIA